MWYIREGDTLYCLSGWGRFSNWLSNLEACPDVLVQIGKETWDTRGTLIQELPETNRVLRMFDEKYGRRTVRLFYHMDRLILLAFPLGNPGKSAATRHIDANGDGVIC